jgi:hypothetical protein
VRLEAKGYYNLTLTQFTDLIIKVDWPSEAPSLMENTIVVSKVMRHTNVHRHGTGSILLLAKVQVKSSDFLHG